MAEPQAKTEQPKPEAEQPPAGGARRGRPVATLGIFGGVMIAEGLAIFLCMKFLGATPDPTHGLEGLQTTTKPWSENQEFDVATLRVLNRTGPRAMLYSVHVVITAHYSKKDHIDEFLKNRKSTVEDALSQVIRSADEKQLAEPGLETLRRQLRFELNTLIGDDKTIDQVLIPEFTPLPTGY
jgi:flagellar basal body-associated protein FliL